MTELDVSGTNAGAHLAFLMQACRSLSASLRVLRVDSLSPVGCGEVESVGYTSTAAGWAYAATYNASFSIEVLRELLEAAPLLTELHCDLHHRCNMDEPLLNAELVGEVLRREGVFSQLRVQRLLCFSDPDAMAEYPGCWEEVFSAAAAHDSLTILSIHAHEDLCSDEREMQALCHAIRSLRLRELRISSCGLLADYFDDDRFTLLIIDACVGHPTLQSINLCGNAADSGLVRRDVGAALGRLVESAQAGKSALERLHLGECCLKDGLLPIFEALGKPGREQPQRGLRKLVVYDNAVPARFCEMILRAVLANASLQKLDFGNTNNPFLQQAMEHPSGWESDESEDEAPEEEGEEDEAEEEYDDEDEGEWEEDEEE